MFAFTRPRVIQVVLVVTILLSGQWGYAQKADEIPNTQQLAIPFTPPTDALKMLKLPEGFKATLFAHEPDIHQPIAVTTDSRGRLWIVECLTYSDRKQNYDLALNDRVIIMEDTDHDGIHDKRTVFWDEGKKLTGIEVGFGGVWLTAAPNLLFIPDRDGDDKPDGEPQILLDGFNGDEIRHNIVNGLRWGPDGWLYGRHGIQATSHVGVPGASESQRTPMNCAIWRIHPETNDFEIVAEGGTNPWGFDFNDQGEMFMINTVIGHMFHVVPGARYRRMYGAHFNPHTYQVIEQTADHFHWDTAEEHWAVTKKEGMSSGTDAAGGGHAHTGLMCYLGDNWPEQYRNQWFTANFHGRRINVERAERDGNGYTVKHEPDMIQSEDPWFRGIEMIYGPDGGVYLLDWSDIGECHENDGIHRTSGRIFKITYGNRKKPNSNKPLDLTKWTDEQLVLVNLSDNQWHVRQARRILQERFVAGNNVDAAKQYLIDLIEKLGRERSADTNNKDARSTLRAIWALHAVGGTNSKVLMALTNDSDEHVRAWAVRLLVDRPTGISQEEKIRLTEMAKEDASGLVRLYLAVGLSRFDLKQDYDVFYHLLQHASDAKDRTQPHLLWNRIEPQVISNPEEAIKLALASKIPLIRENISRRITSNLESNPKAVEKLVACLARFNHGVVGDLSRGMKLALEGRTRVEKPANWDNVYKNQIQWKTSDLGSALPDSTQNDLRKLNVLFGDGLGIEGLRNLATNNNASIESRRQSIVEYAATRPEGLFEFLKPLINNKALSNSVIKGMLHVDESNAANVILNRFGHLDPAGKLIAIDVLTSRAAWAKKLLTAVEKNRVPSSALLAQHARQIAEFDDKDLTAQLTSVWGSVRKTDESRLADIERVREICEENASLTGSKKLARYKTGQNLFKVKCANCHVIYGTGANVGPDLTGGDRKNMNYLLENIIDPNASVADSYRASKFMLKDGRLVTGVVLQKTERTTKIQTATETLTLDNNDIEDSKPTEKSLMPDGLLDNMEDDQIRAMFFFLSSERMK